MPTGATFAAFAAASLALLVIPGPAVMYIVTRSVHQGRRAGVVSALGVDVGVLVHVVAAVAGLSALLAASAFAFTTIKLLGAAYLIFLGVRTLMSKPDAAPQARTTNGSLRSIFVQGVIVNILNPKLALFFLAFLPQFVDPARGGQTLQLLVLGMMFFVLALLSDTAYALVMGTAGSWLRSRPRYARNERRITGGLYIALGLTAAVAGNRKS